MDFCGNGLVCAILAAVFLWRAAGTLFERFGKIAVIREARLITDIQQVFLLGEDTPAGVMKPHSRHILLKGLIQRPFDEHGKIAH